MQTKLWPFAALLLVAAVACGRADEPRQNFKYVGHVVVAYAASSPKYQQKSAEEKLTSYHKIGEVWADDLREVVSPSLRLKYLPDMQWDFSVGANDREELQRLMEELESRRKRPIRVSFQLLATGEDYAKLMGKDADPKIVNTHILGGHTPIDEKHRKILKDGKVAAEWLPVERGIAYDYFAVAHVLADFGKGDQLLVLNSSNDLSDRDIEAFLDKGESIGLKFKPEAHERLKAQTSDQVRLSAIVADGRIEFITAPCPPIENGTIEFYGKMPTPALMRTARFLRIAARPPNYRLVKSYVEGE